MERLLMDDNHVDDSQIDSLTTVPVKHEDEENFSNEKPFLDSPSNCEEPVNDTMAILSHLAEGGSSISPVDVEPSCSTPQPYLPFPPPADGGTVDNYWDQVYVPRAPEALAPGGGSASQQPYYFYYDYHHQQYYAYPAEVYHHTTYHPPSVAPSTTVAGKRNLSVDQQADESSSTSSNGCTIKAYGTYTANGEKIRRPPNAFMIFAKERRREILYSSQCITNKEVSKQLGIEWRALPDATKAYYQRLSEEMRHEHQLKYPGYYYSPVEARKRKEEKRQKKANERSTRSRPD